MFIAGVLIQNYTLKEWSKYSSSSSPRVPVKSLSLQCRIKLLMEQCLHVRCLTFFRIKWETRGGERERKREVFLPEKNLHAVITCSSPMTSGLKKNDFPFSQKISLRFTWIAAEKKKRILLYSLTSLLFFFNNNSNASKDANRQASTPILPKMPRSCCSTWKKQYGDRD